MGAGAVEPLAGCGLTVRAMPGWGASSRTGLGAVASPELSLGVLSPGGTGKQGNRYTGTPPIPKKVLSSRLLRGCTGHVRCPQTPSRPGQATESEGDPQCVKTNQGGCCPPALFQKHDKVSVQQSAPFTPTSPTSPPLTPGPKAKLRNLVPSLGLGIRG